jgi:hypothetical protein
MRPLAFMSALLVALSATGVATAAPKAPETAKVPEAGFVVFKDLRSHAVTEIRDKATGRVVASTTTFGDKSEPGTACGDSRHKLIGAYWQGFKAYFVNIASTPSYLNRTETLADVNAAHKAWESPFTTDCLGAPTGSKYRSTYAGKTSRDASLVGNLSTDGVNVVAFRSLAGTICDGGIACVVIDYKGSKINEADFAFERDLTRYGYQDFWTTDDTTWVNSVGARLAVSDTATHEWGHFAGLDHVDKSPTLTMFPAIHDGAQTLGLGDMKGILARY